MPRDEDSTVVTIHLDQEGPVKTLTQAKLDQLAAAREKAIASRRRKQRDALQAKLNELRRVLGEDLRNETVELFASAIMRQEKRLRAKQNTLTQELTVALQGCRDEIASLRDMTYANNAARPNAKVSTTKVSQTPSTTRTPSEVSAVSSRGLKPTTSALSDISYVSSRGLKP